MIETTAYFTLITFTAKIFLFIIVGIIILLLDILLDYYFCFKKNKKRTIMYDMVIYFLLGSIASLIFQ